ncbi:GGDEF domain-containing protein [Thalassotalea montiporae]
MTNQSLPSAISPNFLNSQWRSYSWLWLSISIVHWTVFAFVYKFQLITAPAYLTSLASYLIGISHFAYKFKTLDKLDKTTANITVGLSVINWLLIASTLANLWSVYSAAENILLVAFFSLAISITTSLRLLVISTVPVIASSVFYHVFYLNTAGLELFVALAFYPLILAALISTKFRFSKTLSKQNKELKRLNKELTHLKNTDPLTQLNNRGFFDDKLNYLVDLHHRNQQPLSLIILDVDFFKKYNDSLGHPAGDQCLKIIASTLSRVAKRDTDIVARIGGEEFAIILPSTNKASACQLADKLANAVREENITHPQSSVCDYVTISLGVTQLFSDNVEQPTTPQELYIQADTALYEAKQNGRNGYQPFTDATSDKDSCKVSERTSKVSIAC